MAQPVLALRCTGDPLFDRLLERCTTVTLLEEIGETAVDGVRLAEQHRPAILFVSSAAGDVGLLEAHPGSTVIYLVEQGAGVTAVAPAAGGASRLMCTGSPLTAETIDSFLRSMSGAPVGRSGVRVPKEAPANKPTAGFKVPVLTPEVGPQRDPHRDSAHEALREAAAAPRKLPGAGRSGEAPAGGARSPQPSVLRQRIVALWGGKPGAGRTTLAAGLSDLLSRLGGVKVCTVDLNPYNSSLATLVGKDQVEPSWFTLAGGMERNQAAVGEALRWIQPNWAILTGVGGRTEWLDLLTADTVSWLVDELRGQFDYILLDLETRSGPVVDVALRLAQTILVVISPDYPDVLDTHAALDAAAQRKVLDPSRCRLVLSRWVETSALPAAMVSQFIGLPISARIPAGAEAVIAASAQGVPVTRSEVPSARPVTQAMGQAVQLVAEALSQSESGRGLFGLFHR